MKWVPRWVYLAVILFAICTVWVRLYVVRTSYRINQTNKMVRNAESELEKVELELARLRSPQNLSQLAKNKFRLTPPSPDQIVLLKDTQ